MCKDAVYEKRGPLVSKEWFPGSLRIAKPEMRSLQNKRNILVSTLFSAIWKWLVDLEHCGFEKSLLRG